MLGKWPTVLVSAHPSVPSNASNFSSSTNSLAEWDSVAVELCRLFNSLSSVGSGCPVKWTTSGGRQLGQSKDFTVKYDLNSNGGEIALLDEVLADVRESMGPVEHDTFQHPVFHVYLLPAVANSNVPNNLIVPLSNGFLTSNGAGDDLLAYYVNQECLGSCSLYVQISEDPQSVLLSSQSNANQKNTMMINVLADPVSFTSNGPLFPASSAGNARASLEFMQKFYGGILVPFMQRQVQQWTETYYVPRRGLTGRLMSVGRKYFSSSSFAASASNLFGSSSTPSTQNQGQQNTASADGNNGQGKMMKQVPIHSLPSSQSLSNQSQQQQSSRHPASVFPNNNGFGSHSNSGNLFNQPIVTGQHLTPISANNVPLFHAVTPVSGSRAGSAVPSRRASTIASVLGSQSIVYHYSSAEAMLRKLADWLVMLGDYKKAMTIYETVKKDYQSDRAYRYYAGVQEMIGLCTIMASMNQFSGEKRIGAKQGDSGVEAMFESAISTYLDAGFKADAFQTALNFYKAYNVQGNHYSAARALLRIMGEYESTQTGLLCEYAALAFQKCGSLRKYGSWMYMASENYSAALLHVDMYRCLVKADEYYSALRNSGWLDIANNLSYNLAVYFSNHDLKLALDHAAKLFTNSRTSGGIVGSSLVAHGGYLRLFVSLVEQYVKKHGAPAPDAIPDINILTVNITKTEIGLESHISRAQLPSPTLQKSHTRPNEDDEPKPDGKLIGNQDEVAVWEIVYVKLRLQNPFGFQLNIKEAKLNVVFHESKQSQNDKLNAISPSKQVASDSSWIQNIGFQIQNLNNIIVPASSFIDIEFKLIPQVPGTLEIMGLQVYINEHIQLRRDFTHLDENIRKILQVPVTPPMPRLEVELEETAPEYLYSGEYIQLKLKFRNAGKHAISFIKAKLSHPSFFLFDADLANDSSETVSNAIKINSTVDFKHSKTAPMEPDTEQTSTLWLRGEKIGKQEFKFRFEYGGRSTKPRHLHFGFSSLVMPSIRVNAFTRVSDLRPTSHIIGVEVENMLSDKPIEIEKIMLISPKHRLAARNKLKPKTEIDCGRSHVMYFSVDEDSNVGFDIETILANNLKNVLLDAPGITPYPHVNIIKSQHQILNTETDNIVDQTAVLFSQKIKNTWRMNQLDSKYSCIEQSKRANLFSLYSSKDADLVVFWRTFTMGSIENKSLTLRRGQHHIVGMSLGIHEPPIPRSWNMEQMLTANRTGRSLYAQTEFERNLLIKTILRGTSPHDSPIKAVVKCPDSATLNFGPDGYCEFDFELELFYLSSFDQELPCHITLEYDSTDDRPLDLDGAWLGPLNIRGTLGASKDNRKISVPLKYAVVNPGVYDLNRWTLRVMDPLDTSKTLHIFEPKKPAFVRILSAMSEIPAAGL